ncbi:RHS repeat-associated protein [Phycicoccus duodecadis]|uniref:RHS repeat-associated protein n=2 Tax=Phycicoccus duodecadis TaxID=173053 RepID=A0A2N3YID0_9MICO|nr:RHS repeat-associated protein [Phycicoccus duodecadis]
MTTGDNAQVGEFGLGWSLGNAFVERQYKSCATDGGSTPDLCWPDAGESLRLSLGGQSARLVRDPAATPVNSGALVYRLQDDPGWKVEKLSGGTVNNGDNDRERFAVYTPDGTTYWFGQNAASDATWTVPVFGEASGEPCHQSTFATSWCQQGWRWNLDIVVDRNGNYTRYYYGAETNHYRLNGASDELYVRGGYLSYVDYSMASPSSQPQARVQFIYRLRCTAEADGSLSTADRGCPAVTTAAATQYPDTPADLYCFSSCAEKAPTFFSLVLIREARALRWNGSAFAIVDSTAFAYTFPTTNDGTSPMLWLYRIQRTGTQGTVNASTPMVSFTGVALDNRVDWSSTVPKLKKYRVDDIVDELGGETLVTYGHGGGGACPSPTPTSGWDSNTAECFPRYWTPESGPAGFGIFHKYVATQVVRPNPYAGFRSAKQTFTYSYIGDAAWHHDDDPIAPNSTQSWGDWRGYRTVQVRELSDPTWTGGPATNLSLSTNTYYLGMHLDEKVGGVKSVSFTDSSGTTLTDWAYAEGLLREEVSTFVSAAGSNGGEASGVIHGYAAARVVQAGSSADTTRDAYRMYEAATDARQSIIDGGGAVSTRTLYTRVVQDQYGRETQRETSGRLLPTSGTFAQCAKSTYTQDFPTLVANRTEYPASVSQYWDACATANAPLRRRTETYYDGSSTLGAAVGAGNVTMTKRSLTGSSQSTTQAAYDTYGRVTSATDARNNVTSTVYNPTLGIPSSVTVTNAANQSSVTTLEPERMLPKTVTDANQNTTTTSYDGLGRLAAVWLPGQATTGPASTTFAYTLDADRNLPPRVATSQLQPNSTYLTSYAYFDQHGQPRQTQSPTVANGVAAVLLVNTERNDRAQVMTTTTPFVRSGTIGGGMFGVDPTSVNLTRTKYDSLGRPTSSSYEAAGALKWSTTTAYFGDRTRTTPPAGGVVHTDTNDLLGRVTTREEGTGGVVIQTENTYDLSGRLTQIKDPANHVSTYQYDLADRLTSSTDPDAGTTTNTYDDNNNLTQSVRGAVTLSTAYDALNRPTSIWNGPVSTGTKLTETSYDTATGGKGYPAVVTTYQGGAAYTTAVAAYSNRGAPTGMTWTFPALGGKTTPTTISTSQTYEPTTGRPVTTALPALGTLAAETLTTGYDALGAPNSLTTSLGGITTLVQTTLNPNRTLASRILGTGTNAVTRSYGWDAATERLATVSTSVATTGGATAAQNDTYLWNPAGNLTSVTDTLPATDVRTCHDYDGYNRLTHSWTTTATTCDTSDTSTAAGPAGYNTSWTYTTDGNINSVRRGTTTSQYTYDTAHPHAAATANGSTYVYNPRGEMTSRGPSGSATALTWDALSHLASVTPNAGASTSFVHASNGARLTRTTPDGTVTLYAGGDELDIRDGATTAARRTYGLAGTTVAVRTQAGLTWQVNDRQGSVDLQINAATGAVGRAYTDPFGEPRAGSATLATDKGWLGKTRDATTGLTELGARYYDTALARFLSTDPLNDQSTSQTGNPYTYSSNNPVNYADPTGLSQDAGTGEYGKTSVKKVNGVPTTGLPASTPSTNQKPPKPPAPKPAPSPADEFSDGLSAGAKAPVQDIAKIISDPSGFGSNLADALSRNPWGTIGEIAKSLLASANFTDDLFEIAQALRASNYYLAGTLVGEMLVNGAIDAAMAVISLGVGTAVVAGIRGGVRAAVASMRTLSRVARTAPEANATVRDLLKVAPGNGKEATKAASAASRTDQELLDSVFTPRDGEHMATYPDGRTLAQGNHRRYELLNRAVDPSSEIQWDTPIFIRGWGTR